MAHTSPPPVRPFLAFEGRAFSKEVSGDILMLTGCASETGSGRIHLNKLESEAAALVVDKCSDPSQVAAQEGSFEAAFGRTSIC